MTTPEVNAAAGPSAAQETTAAPVPSPAQPGAAPLAEVERHLDVTQAIAGELQLQLGQSAAPAAEQTSTVHKPHETPAALKELDQSLAQNIDDLLQGDFETIDAVMNEAVDGAPAAQVGPQNADGAGELCEPLVVDVTAEVAASALNASPIADVAHSISPPAKGHQSVQESKASQRATPRSLPAAVVAPPPAPHALPNANQIENKPEKPPRSLANMSTPLLKAVMLLNLPLRFVPAKLLPIVNIVALSLPMWAALVWIMAINGGHSSAANESISPAKPAMHKESSHAPAESHAKTDAGHSSH